MTAGAMGPATRLAHAEDALHRVMEGEAVLVDLATGTYFGLNETGTCIWERLGAEGGATLDEVAAALVEEFEVERGTAAKDARDLLERLAARGLVRVLPPA